MWKVHVSRYLNARTPRTRTRLEMGKVLQREEIGSVGANSLTATGSQTSLPHPTTPTPRPPFPLDSFIGDRLHKWIKPISPVCWFNHVLFLGSFPFHFCHCQRLFLPEIRFCWNSGQLFGEIWIWPDIWMSPTSKWEKSVEGEVQWESGALVITDICHNRHNRRRCSLSSGYTL